LVSEKSISVLIANYNWDVSALIKELHQQLLDSKVSFEILCYDNSKGSTFESENLKLNNLENVSYKLEHHHIGRSQNRNKLAHDAKLDWFLFLDGDSAIPNSEFIANYLKTSNSAMVVCGGTAYADKPTNKNQLLRWTYGKEREELNSDTRNEKANSGFSSFNFLIRREAFELVGFNNELTQYGHEDTLFGQDLKKHHFTVLHIKNPLVHLGLDENQVFLDKTKEALQNLKILVDSKVLENESKLTSYYLRLSKTRTKRVITALFRRNKEKWEKNLCGIAPNMRMFDLYRLGYLCSL
jgi:glycosyltransferase involved in cell wall biosynthesis